MYHDNNGHTGGGLKTQEPYPNGHHVLNPVDLGLAIRRPTLSAERSIDLPS